MVKRGWASKPGTLEAQVLAQRAAFARSAANFYALALDDARAPKPGNEQWAQGNLTSCYQSLYQAVASLPTIWDASAVLADVAAKHPGKPEVLLVIRVAACHTFGYRLCEKCNQFCPADRLDPATGTTFCEECGAE